MKLKFLLNDSLSETDIIFSTHVLSKDGQVIRIFPGFPVDPETMKRMPPDKSPGVVGLFIQEEVYDSIDHSKTYILMTENEAKCFMDEPEDVRIGLMNDIYKEVEGKANGPTN